MRAVKLPTMSEGEYMSMLLYNTANAVQDFVANIS